MAVEFLGNISQNKYNYQPLTRQTKFGTRYAACIISFFRRPKKDKYSTYFGALKTSFKQSDSFTLKFIGSVFHTIEQEYFDIFAQYRLGWIVTSAQILMVTSYTKGIGSQLIIMLE
jgi:hypothetical protein